MFLCDMKYFVNLTMNDYGIYLYFFVCLLVYTVTIICVGFVVFMWLCLFMVVAGIVTSISITYITIIINILLTRMLYFYITHYLYINIILSLYALIKNNKHTITIPCNPNNNTHNHEQQHQHKNTNSHNQSQTQQYNT